jgi:hypothetical protein
LDTRITFRSAASAADGLHARHGVHRAFVEKSPKARQHSFQPAALGFGHIADGG